jgi:hypothetical protein
MGRLKKLTNRQRLFEIGRALLTAKEPEIVEKLNTYIYDVSNVYTDGKIAQIEISDERENKIIYQFDKPKLWKGEPQLDKAHLVGEDDDE